MALGLSQMLSQEPPHSLREEFFMINDADLSERIRQLERLADFNIPRAVFAKAVLVEATGGAYEEGPLGNTLDKLYRAALRSEVDEGSSGSKMRDFSVGVLRAARVTRGATSEQAGVEAVLKGKDPIQPTWVNRVRVLSAVVAVKRLEDPDVNVTSPLEALHMVRRAQELLKIGTEQGLVPQAFVTWASRFLGSEWMEKEVGEAGEALETCWNSGANFEGTKSFPGLAKAFLLDKVATLAELQGDQLWRCASRFALLSTRAIPSDAELAGRIPEAARPVVLEESLRQGIINSRWLEPLTVGGVSDDLVGRYPSELFFYAAQVLDVDLMERCLRAGSLALASRNLWGPAKLGYDSGAVALTLDRYLNGFTPEIGTRFVAAMQLIATQAPELLKQDPALGNHDSASERILTRVLHRDSPSETYRLAESAWDAARAILGSGYQASPEEVGLLCCLYRKRQQGKVLRVERFKEELIQAINSQWDRWGGAERGEFVLSQIHDPLVGRHVFETLSKGAPPEGTTPATLAALACELYRTDLWDSAIREGYVANDRILVRAMRKLFSVSNAPGSLNPKRKRAGEDLVRKILEAQPDLESAKFSVMPVLEEFAQWDRGFSGINLLFPREWHPGRK